MIVFVNAQSAYFGGGLEYLKNQLKALEETKKDVKIILWTNPKNHKDFKDFLGNKRIKYIKTPYLPYYLRFIAEQILCPLLSSYYRADVVYMPGNVACFLTLKKQVLVFQNPNLFFKVRGRKSIPYAIKRFFQRFIARMSMLRADKVVFISKDLKQRAMKGGRKNVYVLYSGVNIEEKEEDIEVARYKPYILAVSNITYHKNYPALLEAFEIVYKKRPDVNLVIAGKIMDEQYFDEITAPYRDKEVWKNIYFLGGVEHKKLPKLYKNSELYVTTTLLEAFPLTPFEAMYFGTPVVSSRASSLPEICHDAALYIDPLNPEDIAEKLLLVLHDDALRNRLIQKGRERIKKFTWEKNAENLYSIMQS